MKNPPLDDIKITSGYGWRVHPVTKQKKMHNGVDLRALEGTPIYVVDDGMVVASKYTNTGPGEYITVKHGGYFSFYCHLSQRRVVKGQKVKAGDIIGLTGNTGISTGPHLHFGLCTRYVASSIDISRWFNPEPHLMEVRMKLKTITAKINGKMVKLSSIEHKDENYVRLRDLAANDGFKKFTVDYDPKTDTVIINTIGTS
jgi:murein DD-endopeptidase MepM/ murein hydrolase activator NlpD